MSTQAGLYTLFRAQLSEQAEHGSELSAHLLKLLGDNGRAGRNGNGDVFAVIRPLSEDSQDDFIVTITGKNDHLLNKWGQKIGLPRGYHIAWKPSNKRLFHFGFYPKFENDKLQNYSQGIGDFENVDTLSGNRKFSGCLFISACLDGRNLTIMSKNGFNSPLTAEIHQLISGQFSPSLLNEMFENHLCICGEVMLASDRNHGSNHQPGFVVTAVGQGSVVSLDSVLTVRGNTEGFVKYLDIKEMNRFCHQYQLPVASTFTIKQYQVIKEFLDRLEAIRNIIDAEMFDQLLNDISIQHPQQVDITPGNIIHQQLCGRILEGLVLRLYNGDTKTNTLKYKFPNYTWRTFGLRSLFHQLNPNNQNDNRNRDFRPLEDKDLLTFIKARDSYITRWTLDDQYRPYLTFNFILAYRLFNQTLLLWNQTMKDDPNSPNFHIFLADLINQQSPYQSCCDYQYLVEQQLSQEPENLLNIFSVVLVLGPIGSGKTSVANRIVEQIAGSQLFDTDRLFNCSNEMTFCFGAERNTASCGQLYQLLLSGKIPVIATGGGQFLTTRENIFIHLADHYNCRFNITIVLVGASSQPNELFSIDRYCDLPRLEQTVRQRGWKTPAEQLVNFSRRNYNIQSSLVSQLENRGFVKQLISVDQVNYPEFLEKIIDIPMIDPPSIVDRDWRFSQHRLLTCCTDRLITSVNRPYQIGHITLRYQKDSLDHTLTNFIGSQIPATLVSNENFSVLVVELPVDQRLEGHLLDGINLYQRAHVTINAGPYNPAEMLKVAAAYLQGRSEVILNNKKNQPCKEIFASRGTVSLSIIGEYLVI